MEVQLLKKGGGDHFRQETRETECGVLRRRRGSWACGVVGGCGAANHRKEQTTTPVSHSANKSTLTIIKKMGDTNPSQGQLVNIVGVFAEEALTPLQILKGALRRLEGNAK